MSTYWDMWEMIKSFDEKEAKDWLDLLKAPHGKGVNFNGIYVNDVDLIEALTNYVEDK